MTTIELHLVEALLQRAHQLAEMHRVGLEEVLAFGLEQLERVAPQRDMLPGLFADDPHLID